MTPMWFDDNELLRTTDEEIKAVLKSPDAMVLLELNLKFEGLSADADPSRKKSSDGRALLKISVEFETFLRADKQYIDLLSFRMQHS